MTVSVSVAMTVAVAMSIVGVPIRRVADGIIGILFYANDAAFVVDVNFISLSISDCSDQSDRTTDDRIIARQVDKHITFSLGS